MRLDACVIAATFVFSGCSGSSSATNGSGAEPGTSGGSCVDGDLCDFGLTCVAKVCQPGSWGEQFDGAPPSTAGAPSGGAPAGAAGSVSSGAGTGTGGTSASGATTGSGGIAVGAGGRAAGGGGSPVGRGGTVPGNGGSASGSGGNASGSGGNASGGVPADGGGAGGSPASGGVTGTGGTTLVCFGSTVLFAGPRKGECPTGTCRCSDAQYSDRPCFSALEYPQCCSTGTCP